MELSFKGKVMARGNQNVPEDIPTELVLIKRNNWKLEMTFRQLA